MIEQFNIIFLPKGDSQDSYVVFLVGLELLFIALIEGKVRTMGPKTTTATGTRLRPVREPDSLGDHDLTERIQKSERVTYNTTLHSDHHIHIYR